MSGEKFPSNASDCDDQQKHVLANLERRAAAGQIGRRGFLQLASAIGIGSAFVSAMADRAMASPQVQGQGGRKIEASYDYTVVGAGSSGCVLAARLSEDPACRVLLIEAGGADISRLLYKARRSGQPISEPMPIGPIVQYRRPKPQVAPSTGPRYPAARSIQTLLRVEPKRKTGSIPLGSSKRPNLGRRQNEHGRRSARFRQRSRAA